MREFTYIHRGILLYITHTLHDDKWYAVSSEQSPRFCFCGDNDKDVIAKAKRAIKYYKDTKRD